MRGSLNSMSFEELEKLYLLTVDNGLSITKHDVICPSLEVADELVKKYKIIGGAKKYIQVLSSGKLISFVFTVGDLLLFENICNPKDEYIVHPYDESEK